MKLYYDLFAEGQSNQVLSDGFKVELCYEGVIGKVQSAMVVQGEVNVDVGCGNQFGGKEEEEQGGSNPVVKVNNILNTYNYEECSVADFKAFMEFFKPYMKKLLAHLQKSKPQRVEAFKNGAKQFLAYMKDEKNFKEISFYTPKDCWDLDNCVIMSYYEEGAEAPIFMYFMDGLKEVKV